MALMQILKETTIWDTKCSVINHTYLLDNSNRLIAHARGDTGEIVICRSKSLIIDKRQRSFKLVKHPGLERLITPEKRVGVRLFKVQSGQKVYGVELQKNSYTCTCTGYTFRRKCKHGDAVLKKLEVEIARKSMTYEGA